MSSTAGTNLSWPLGRFMLLFGGGYGLFMWLATCSGPLAPLNAAVAGLTRLQTGAAGLLLRLCGEPLTISGNVLSGPAFHCDVAEGCNGMSALGLLLVGILAFPTPPRWKLFGTLLFAPLVLAVNVLRIGGLYWVGAHASGWFNTSHVYVGQVLVILLTAGLWWTWLSLAERPSA